jgi:maltooligosyltrehalose synthase
VLVPCLGNSIGAVLQSGELKLSFNESHCFVFSYYNKWFPLDPSTYEDVLTALDKQEEIESLVVSCAAIPTIDMCANSQEASRIRHELCSQLKLTIINLFKQNPEL